MGGIHGRKHGPLTPKTPRILSIIIPVYNEYNTLTELVDRVLAVKLPEGMEKQLILVDDYSTDGTRRLYGELRSKVSKILLHKKNQGKGAAIRTGLKHATGEFLIIQDADLEYNPDEYPKLLQPLLHDQADVVYGSRFLGTGERRVLYFWHTVGNSVLTLLSNMFTNLNLTDMETCYKMFRRSILEGIQVEQNRFGFEPEITAKLAKRKARFYEIGISYHGRTYEEGKKIGLKDAFSALYCIVRYSRATTRDVGRQTLEILEGHGEYAKWIYSQIEPHLGDRVLEFGSGLGSLARLAVDREHLYITEQNPAYLEQLKRQFGHLPNVSIHSVDITDPPAELADAEIDTIFSSNVVEHIDDHLGALRAAYGLLNPGGKIVILVPAFMQLYSPLDENLEHYRRYTKNTLTRVLRDAGFVVEETHYMNMIGAIGWFVAGRILRQSVISGFNVWAHKIIEPFSRAIDALFGRRPPFGLSVIAVARKPR